MSMIVTRVLGHRSRAVSAVARASAVSAASGSTVSMDSSMDSSMDGSAHAGHRALSSVGWEITWECGPDAGGRTVLSPGAWVLGRSAAAAVRADDPTVEPFHLDLHLPVGVADPPTWVQLAGRRPVQPIDGDLLSIGAGLVRLRRAAMPPSCGWAREGGTGWRGGLVVRSGRLPPPALDEVAMSETDRERAHLDDRPLDPGEPPDAATALVPAVVTCAAAVALAVVIGQPMLAAMAAVGAVVACTLWLLAWARHRRRVREVAAAAVARSDRASVAADRRRHLLEAHHRLAHPGIAAARRLFDVDGSTTHEASASRAITLGDPPHGLWERRPWHDDAFVVVCGCGAVEVDDPIGDLSTRSVLPGSPRSMVLEDVPIVVDLGPGARVACTGEFADACLRSMLVQLATTTGPADWSLVIVSDRCGRGDQADRWSWLRGLPHLVLTDDGAIVHDDAAAAALLASWIGAAVPPASSAVDSGPIPSAGTTDGGPARHVVVVTDDPDAVAVRTSAIRRLLHARPDAALLGAFGHTGRGDEVDRHRSTGEVTHGVPSSARVPAMCSTVVTTTSDGTVRVHTGDAVAVHRRPSGAIDGATIGTRGRHRADGRAGGRADGRAGGRGRLTGVGRGGARAVVAVLADCIDPEVPVDDERNVPTDVLLDEVMAARGATLERDAIATRWRRSGVDAPIQAPIGRAADGVVELDLVGDGPHGLIAGTTGSGKSELLRTVVVSSCAAVPPDQLALVLVDFKGGATFDGLQPLPHVVGMVTDLEPHLTERVLRSLRAEVTSREHLLRSIGAADLSAARASTGTTVVPRLVVIVDEFAALALDHPALLHALVDIARRGRSLGVHLLLATQRPSGVVSEEIRTNTALRIALRLHDPAEAIDVVGDAAPASFRRSSAGRAVMRLGPGELVTFQSARLASAEAAVAEIAGAADSMGMGRPARPWCDPLPERIDALDSLDGLGGIDPPSESGGAEQAAGVVVGLVDLPDEQRRKALTWQPSDGHVLVVGAAGHGVTTTLSSVAVRSIRHAAHAAEPAEPAEPELVVFDAHGDRRWDEVAGLPPCAGVIRLHERERLDRALRRACSPPPPGGRVVVIDGIAPVRRDLEQPGRTEMHELFESLLLSTPPGVTLLIGTDGSAGLSAGVVSRCAQRWVLHLHDPADGAVFGLRIAEVPPAIAGRMFDAATHREAQLLGWPHAEIGALMRSDADAGAGTGGVVSRIVALPDVVPASELPPSSFDGERWSPVLGLGHRSLQPVALEVPVGEHLLVIGPPRSGRTQMLSQLRRGWSEARPDAAQVVVCLRRVAVSARHAAVADALTHLHHELAAGRPALLVVDDAELVPDPDGHLGALVAAPPDGLAIVAACRSDAVRSHGHWVAGLRRSRRGVLMSPSSDLDADVLGAALPRQAPLPPRPGLCWLVADGTAVLAQAATTTP